MSYYQDIIMRHAKNPMSRGEMPDADHRASGSNPLCGDSVEFFGKIGPKGNLTISFVSQGCALCRASASILLEEVNDKPVAQIGQILDQLIPRFRGLDVVDSPPWTESVAALSDMRRYPSRLSCVLLPWETLQKMMLCFAGS